MSNQQLLAARIAGPMTGTGPTRPAGDRLGAALDGIKGWGEQTPTARRRPRRREHNLAVTLGLPGRLAPVRLPPLPDLAAAARRSWLLARARELARWIGFAGRTCRGELSPGDAAAAVHDLGLSGRHELNRLWWIVVETRLVSFAEERVRCAEKASRWAAASDARVLADWRTALGNMLAPDLLDELGDAEPLDFSGTGGTLMVLLFLARLDGLSCVELGDILRDGAGATAELWQRWTERHGDPVRILAGWLAELGAVEIRAAGLEPGLETARLTPLGLWATRKRLAEWGVEVPLLPASAALTPAELVSFAQGARPGEVAAERAAWLADRDPAGAARELLAYAAAAGPVDRVYAVRLASCILQDRVGVEAARGVWRAALGPVATRAFAQVELGGLDGVAVAPVGAERCWMLVDLVLAHTSRLPDDHIPGRLRGLLDMSTAQLIALISRLPALPHPAAPEALRMLARHFPDEAVAQAARRALRAAQ